MLGGRDGDLLLRKGAKAISIASVAPEVKISSPVQPRALLDPLARSPQRGAGGAAFGVGG
jgi:hypothetical protein